ncbi:hypothetical protein WALSEDRAFT_59769 [Wallemia mellicola CBS 633.66]|uniref:Uncharacterized protein n=1 Tax=Wallemia mellicola (strain ATCC MYA-4683 / CBS 633.66) TaxID=671144 RepID=I4YGJ1_WALMC|nr:hypothetical protein WALSEDRAFT_59769 [Wallemia mellicola CBS 633.66]EIM23083.1 hypothetical protein WALSEDRAFT_59769 [Wallemia mellicola CBS 633.66]|eukprot:XP_006957116.1 hypothetical protein WALSEDRAFT_59769 [Wallemia mellicola CBS 633.66]
MHIYIIISSAIHSFTVHHLELLASICTLVCFFFWIALCGKIFHHQLSQLLVPHDDISN